VLDRGSPAASAAVTRPGCTPMRAAGVNAGESRRRPGERSGRIRLAELRVSVRSMTRKPRGCGGPASPAKPTTAIRLVLYSAAVGSCGRDNNTIIVSSAGETGHDDLAPRAPGRRRVRPSASPARCRSRLSVRDADRGPRRIAEANKPATRHFRPPKQCAPAKMASGNTSAISCGRRRRVASGDARQQRQRQRLLWTVLLRAREKPPVTITARRRATTNARTTTHSERGTHRPEAPVCTLWAQHIGALRCYHRRASYGYPRDPPPVCRPTPYGKTRRRINSLPTPTTTAVSNPANAKRKTTRATERLPPGSA